MRAWAFWASVLVATASCVGGDGVDSSEEAVHGTGVNGVDTSWPAVGFLTGNSAHVTPTIPGDPTDADHHNEIAALYGRWCSGTLVAPRTVLTASHCVEWILDDCQPAAGRGWSALRFALNPTGDGLNHPESTMVYAVDDVKIHPQSHAPRTAACGSDSLRGRLVWMYDLAVLHLAVQPGQPEPATVAQPVEAITSLGDTVYSPFGLHASVDPHAVFDPSLYVQAYEVGWAVEDIAARHLAPTSFLVPEDYQWGVQYVNSSAAATAGGDSGSPAALLAFRPWANGIPFGWWVLGPLYGGNDASSWYPSTFRPDHSRWFESALWYHADDVTPPTMTVDPPAGLDWVAVDASEQPIAEQPPGDFFVGGFDGPPTYQPLGLCKAWYGGGEHPGKLVANLCSFGWGGAEQMVPMYRVLEVAPGAARWVAESGGSVPERGFAAGYEGGRPLYACRASYGGGVHPGKVVGATCNIGWGGSEVALSSYDVLCVPRTCASAGATCGSLSDGCGGTLQCGVCPAGETCGAETPNTCGATCVSHFHCRAGMCGTFDDGCGNDVCCGTATRCCF